MKAGGGDDRGQDGWMALPLNRHEFKQTPGDGEGGEALHAAVHGVTKRGPY